MISDRGLNNRGVFARELNAAGCYTGSIGLEAPYQLARVEKQGDVWKKIASKVIENKGVTGIEQMNGISTRSEESVY